MNPLAFESACRSPLPLFHQLNRPPMLRIAFRSSPLLIRPSPSESKLISQSLNSSTVMPEFTDRTCVMAIGADRGRKTTKMRRRVYLTVYIEDSQHEGGVILRFIPSYLLEYRCLFYLLLAYLHINVVQHLKSMEEYGKKNGGYSDQSLVMIGFKSEWINRSL